LCQFAIDHLSDIALTTFKLITTTAKTCIQKVKVTKFLLYLVTVFVRVHHYMKIKLMEKRGYFEQDCTKLTSEYVVYLMKWNMQDPNVERYDHAIVRTNETLVNITCNA